MKRVGCLYRVSTKKQLYDDDIPMQRKSCRAFIETKEDWMLVKEYYEKGVSGYKLTSEQRSEMAKIKLDVLNKQIDILLVFMFDRIGRQENETPFVVQWLIEHGVEVWSVKEGQRKLESNIDKLLNYMTFWAAEGESEKTSIRATEERIRLTKEGIYMGNYAPYGYELVKSEELISKIGKNRRILQIYEEEAKVVRKIYSLIYNQDYGLIKVARFLNNEGILKRNAKEWRDHDISELVKNPIYKGYVSFGKRNKKKNCGEKRNKKEDWILADKPNPDIIIISEEIFDAVNEKIEKRKKTGEKKLRLLSEMVTCGHCNKSIIPRQKKDSKYTYMVCREHCLYKNCDYSANYRLDKLEPIIINEINNYLDELSKFDYKDMFDKRNKKLNDLLIDKKQKEYKIIKNEEKIESLKKEIVKSLSEKDENKKIELNNKLQEMKDELEKTINDKIKIENKINRTLKKVKHIENYVPQWKEEFNNANLNVQREILKLLVNRIYLYNDKIVIDLKYPINENDSKEVVV